jgi:CubicO group peptidase (beta-lactamase class C family)
VVLAEPGRRRIYSNTGFEVLADAVEGRVGIPFGQYLAEAVLQPLGMAGTRLDRSPAAGMVGPLDDLARLATELLSPTIVATSTLAMATTVAFPGLVGIEPGFGRQSPLDWGLGFEVRGTKSPHWTGRANSPSTFGHFGKSGSFLWVDPAVSLASVVLSGRDFGPWSRREWPAFSDALLAEFA